MNHGDESQEKEKFSDDPQENLRIENEILKLKMQAESGAVFGGDEDIDPEVENNFLQQVQQFEEAWSDRKLVKVYDAIGRPEFKKESELTDKEVEAELRRVQDLMAEKNLCLDVLGTYEPRVIYRFITEELFEHETSDMALPGWSWNFIYEEFHPNHRMDIEKATQDFFKDWFKKEFNEYSWEMSNEVITPEGQVFTRKEIHAKLNNCLQSYLSFSDFEHQITATDFDWNEEDKKGLGYAEGVVRYDATLENGETLHIEGSFKMYMSNEDASWDIYYFIFPGFSWGV